MKTWCFDGTLADWRRVARAALRAEARPEDVRWVSAAEAQAELGWAEAVHEATTGAPGAEEVAATVRVPREFVALTEDVACHRDEGRWARLYEALWRLTHGEPQLLRVATDAAVSALRDMAKAVHRSEHKMRAFVRFREVATAEGPWMVAWFEPEHRVTERNAAFFCDRFASMRWSILTPDACLHWDRRELRVTPGVTREAAPAEDAVEELWRTYYTNIFNPARLKVGAMKAQMPARYWANLPEAEVIPGLVAEARPRAAAMVARSREDAAHRETFGVAPVPATEALDVIREAAAACRACPLWRQATCTVFGEGPTRPRLVVVGEQPGDQEDRQGRPFVGPAGQLLDRALEAAEVKRSDLYVTNAVKHFKWTPQGKRRLHAKPSAREVAACRPWLAAELRVLRPARIVCLGATAAQAVLGRAVKVLSERGQIFDTEWGVPAGVTVHPSALLRLPPGQDPAAAFAAFVADLRALAVG